MSKSQKILLLTDEPHSLIDKVFYDVIGLSEDDIILFTGENLERVIAKNRPSVIVPVGDERLKLLGFNGIVKNAGQVLDYNGTPVVPVLSPKFIERNPTQFSTFAEHLNTASEIASGFKIEEPDNQRVLISNMLDFWRLISHIKETGYVAFDFETTRIKDKGTFDPDFQLIAVAFSFQQGSSYVLLIQHPDSWLNEQNNAEIVKILNEEVFGNYHITKIGHNVKYDTHCTAHWGIERFEGCFHDTMVMSHLLDENTSNKLKDCVRMYIPRFANYESKVQGHDWTRIATDDLVKYAGLDSDMTFRLYWIFTELLFKDERLYHHYRNIDAPSTKTLFKMERRGMIVDKAFLFEAIEDTEKRIALHIKKMRKYPEVKSYNEWMTYKQAEEVCKDYEEKLAKEQEKVYKSAKAIENQEDRIAKYERHIKDFKSGSNINVDPVEINFKSPQQLLGLLYGKHGFNLAPYTDDYGREKKSTDKKVLEYIKDKSPFIDDLIQLRQMEKILSTYLKGLLDRLDSNHRVHPTFNQHVVKTGRLSASGYNSQNVISRTKYKEVEVITGYVKTAFIPPKDHYIVQVDYSQAELRLIAHYAQDKTMLKAYREGQDIHALTAATSRGATLEKFYRQDEKTRKTQRFEAKAVNFGFIYLMTAFGFQDYARTQYGMVVSKRKAEKYKNDFFTLYSGIPHYHKTYIAKANKFGQVRTFFGRAIRIPDIYSPNGAKKKHAENNAVNGPIQGTAGEMTILALALLDHILPEEIQIINSIHDSIKFYIPKNMLHYLPLIQEVMENLPLEEYFYKNISDVKMLTDVELSDKSWGDLEEYSN